jgi:hypothetical protein
MEKNSEVDSVIGSWFHELRRMRVLLCASINKLPDSVGNLKHLRYLEITRTCPSSSLPSAFCCLYNLQRLYAERWEIIKFPNDFSKLISLERFKSKGFEYYPMCQLEIDAASGLGPGVRLIKNMNQFSELRICNLGAISEDEAAEAKLKNKKHLRTLKLDWSSSSTLGLRKHNETEVFEVLKPHTTILKHLVISYYPGVSLPTWFQPQNFPRLATLSFENCVGLESSALSFIRVSQNKIFNGTLDSNNSLIGTFFSLRKLIISGCPNIVSLNDFLDPASVPAISEIRIEDCMSLVSVPTGCLGDMHGLVELQVVNCPSIRSQRLVAPSVKRLIVGGNSKNFADNIDCCSLTDFAFSSDCDTFTLEMWSVPALQNLRISECRSLTSIGTGGVGAFSSLISLTVSGCAKLSTLDDFLTAEHLPAVESITIEKCPELLSLPSERFGSFHSLKDFVIKVCPRVNWHRGLVLPSSLQILSVDDCGDISTVIPSCLQNLAFLIHLEICDCPGITCVPGNIWQSNLLSLKRLHITGCADLESIGGEDAIAKIEQVFVYRCPKIGDICRVSPS